jgi:hypothetical protein
MHRSVASSVFVVAMLAAVGIGTLPARADAHPSRHAGTLSAKDTPTTTSSGTAPVDRVLMISIPHVAWRDLVGLQLPNLDRLFAESAIADMTNRTIGKRDLSSSYLTIGAGTRASSTGLPDDGEGLTRDEQFGALSAGEAFTLRTGEHTSGAVAQLGIATITQANVEQDVDVTVGALGDTLAKGGFARAVIGNGDGLVVDTDVPTYRRFLVNALMGSDGTVPDGQVDASLLEPDDAAPFGVRADLDTTVDAFRAAWQPRSVVLVEASDLARVGDFVPLASASQRKQLLADALQRTDELVGRLLEEVDATRDAVLVVAPGPSNSGDALTIAALRAPGVEPGFLHSASTRRAGFVLLADAGPTVVDLVGLPHPKEMSGSPFVAKAGGRDDAHRRSLLITESKAGHFRDTVRLQVVIDYSIVGAALALLAFLVLTLRRTRRARVVARFAALASLGFVPMVYLARLVPFQEHGTGSYWLTLFAGALVLGVLYAVLGRRFEYGPIMLALAAIVGLQIVDVLLGARLQFSSAFGYSPTVGVRVTGIGNISYSFLSSAALLLSGLVAHKVGGRRGAYAAITILGAALVIDIAPFWGADFGGILSMVPAFGVMALLLLGIRIRIQLRTVVIAGLATFAVLVVAAAIDLSRPANDQTHVGRLISNIGDNGPSKLFSVIGRKLDQNLITLTNSEWRPIVPIALALIAYLAFSERRWLARIIARIPEMRAALIGFAVLAFLGYALNDSGIAIPAVMLTVLNATLIWLVMTDAVQGTEPELPAPSAAFDPAPPRVMPLDVRR